MTFKPEPDAIVNEFWGDTGGEEEGSGACVHVVNCDQKAVADCFYVAGHSGVSHPTFCICMRGSNSGPRACYSSALPWSPSCRPHAILEPCHFT